MNRFTYYTVHYSGTLNNFVQTIIVKVIHINLIILSKNTQVLIKLL